MRRGVSVDEATKRRIIKRLKAGDSWATIAKEERVSRSTLSNINRERDTLNLHVCEGEECRKAVTYGENTGSLDIDVCHPTGKAPRWLDVKSPEKLLEVSGIDTKVWKPANCRVTYSEVTMKLRESVKAGDRYLRKDKPATYTNVHITVQLQRRQIAEQAVMGFVDKLLSSPYKPKPVRAPRIRKDTVLLEWCPYDQHHGMLAWKPEVDENYDIDISSSFFSEAVNKVIDTAAPYRVGQIVVPVGQDWFHCNDPSFQTPFAKHQLDVEGRLLKVFETGYWALFKAIEKLRQVAPVHILWVPGNHDPETSYYLVRALAAHYMDLDGSYHRGVTVDFTPRSRKVYTWGNSCIGFTHPVGKGLWEKQRGIFSEVFKHQWADAKFHEIHTGHLHKVMEMEFMQADTLGSHTVIRMLPSLCATDKWHWEMGFVEKNRASASFIWSQDEGLVCQFTTRVKDDR